MPISTPSYFAGSGGAALAPAARWVSIDRVRKPWAMVPPNGVAAARSGSTWMNWWSWVTSANWFIWSWVDLEPLAGAFVVADVGLEQLERLGCCFAHGAAPYGALS